jgi:5-phospho-D-xylono-1,4-lactonase
MSFVRTVLGDIRPEELGPCGAHEHVIIRKSYSTVMHPDFLLDDVEAIAAELAVMRSAGGRAMVDTMPCDAGRDVLALAEVSRRSGVHVIAPTGLHLPVYYPPGHWGEDLTAEELARLFVADIIEGIDSLDYSCPVVRRTPHRAGVIKVASSRDALTPRELKIFTAACIASRETGAPIITHAEQGTAALEQAAVFRSHGVDLSHVVISHTDKIPDPDYHRRILATGVCLEYDSAIRRARGNASGVPGQGGGGAVDLLTLLLPEFPDQLMAGMDAARRNYWSAFGGGPGMQYLFRELPESLQARGVNEDHIRRLLVSNPARAFSFREPGR